MDFKDIYQKSISKPEEFWREISNDILGVKGRISDLEIELIETGVDVGPAIYLAKAFETDVDTVVKFFIFILIFVFDPLAVSLVLAFNHALQYESKVNETKIDKIYKSYKKSKPKTKEIEIETPKVIKSDSKLTGRGGIKT